MSEFIFCKKEEKILEQLL